MQAAGEMMRNIGCLVIVSISICANKLPAARAAEASGTSDQQAQQEARRKIPYSKLDADARAKVDAVLSDVTFFRRLPTQVIRCDPDLFAFMTTHPDLTVNIWQVLQLSQINVVRTGRNTFHADDGAGTQSDLQYLHTSLDTQLVYAVGEYKGPLLGAPIRGGCLLLVKTSYFRDAEGDWWTRVSVDVFVRVDHFGAGLLTRTFQPLVNDSADRNLKETAAFLRNLSLTAEIDPDYMKRLSGRLTKVRADDRQKFVELTALVAQRAKGKARKTAQLSEEIENPLAQCQRLSQQMIPPPTPTVRP
jgi:hypothetical protein